MCGENEWYNEDTNTKQEVYKATTFWNLPNILVICLKRFSLDGKRKLMHLVNFPLENLDLSKYVKGYNPNQYVYDLYGVCNHFGGVHGGHYTAYIKDTSHNNINDNMTINHWLHYNDTSVDIITNPNIVVSPAAYCLFYRKRILNKYI